MNRTSRSGPSPARWPGTLCRIAAAAGLALAIAGLLCRGRDTNAIAATLYYGTPWLLRLLAAAFALAVWKHRTVRLAAAMCFLVSAAEGVRSWHAPRPDAAPPAGAVHATVWNAGRELVRRRDAWPALGRADIIAITEAGRFTPLEWREFMAATRGVEWRRLDVSLLVGTRGRIVSVEEGSIPRLCRTFAVTVELPGHGTMPVVLVDVNSQPWRPRQPSLQAIRDISRGDPRAIVLGDFNTPPGARGFRDWRVAGLQLANNGPRDGFRETWAHGLPLLAIDHAWLGPAWQPAGFRKSLHGSDHALLDVHFLPR